MGAGAYSIGSIRGLALSIPCAKKTLLHPHPFRNPNNALLSVLHPIHKLAATMQVEPIIPHHMATFARNH